jgi:hypothetical protein
MQLLKKLGVLLALAPAVAVADEAVERKLDTALIDKLTGASGKYCADDHVYKVMQPRDDLKVTVNGVNLTAAMGLKSWASFGVRDPMLGSKEYLVNGDLCLLEGQVNPVLSTALQYGLDVTALHNSFLYDSPRVFLMHIHGTGGDLNKLASAVGEVFKKIRDPIAAAPAKLKLDPAKTNLDGLIIDNVLGLKDKGKLSDGVYSVFISRTTNLHDWELSGALGVYSRAWFIGGNDEAVAGGTLAVYEKELTGVLRALRGANICILAIDSNMTFDDPRVISVRFWGSGTTADLAKGLRAAFDVQGIEKPEVTAMRQAAIGLFNRVGEKMF